VGSFCLVRMEEGDGVKRRVAMVFVRWEMREAFGSLEVICGVR